MNKIGSDQSIWPVRQETGQVQGSFGLEMLFDLDQRRMYQTVFYGWQCD